jgi:hypothetical protein
MPTFNSNIDLYPMQRQVPILSLAFAHYESNPNSMVSIISKTSPTLAFAHYESNPNSTVFVIWKLVQHWLSLTVNNGNH